MATDGRGGARIPPSGVTVARNCPRADNPEASAERDPCLCPFCHGPMYHRDTMAGEASQCTCPDCGATCVADFEGPSWMDDWDGESY